MINVKIIWSSMFNKIKKFFGWLPPEVEEFNPNIAYDIPKDQFDDQLKQEWDLSKKANFVFNECKQRLLSTIETANILQKKAVLILGFIFSIVSLSISKLIDLYSFDKIHILTIYDSKIAFFLIAISISYALVAMLILLSCFVPRYLSPAGNEPVNFLVPERINRTLSLILLDEARTYQKRILINDAVNEKTASWINGGVGALISLPVLFGVAIIFFNNFFTICSYFPKLR